MSLTACASPPIQPVSVLVNKDGMHVLGTTVKTVDELEKLLVEKKINRIVVRTEPENDYDAIGKIIFRMSRNNVQIEAINGMALK
jgi:biopolymer transport protein ExbD